MCEASFILFPTLIRLFALLSSHVKWREKVFSRTQWMAWYLRMLECVLLSYTHISLSSKHRSLLMNSSATAAPAALRRPKVDRREIVGPQQCERKCWFTCFSFISSGSNASVCFFRREIASAFHFFFNVHRRYVELLTGFFSPALPVHHIYTPGPATLHFKQLFFLSRSSSWCGVWCAELLPSKLFSACDAISGV